MLLILARQGHGSLCSNHENFDGYVFGTFSCPLPLSTGMNQLDQFCCGPANYQYCCNMQFVFFFDLSIYFFFSIENFIKVNVVALSIRDLWINNVFLNEQIIHHQQEKFLLLFYLFRVSLFSQELVF